MPFSDHAENSSQVIATLLSQSSLPRIDLRSVILPVSYHRAFEDLKVEIDKFRPEFIINLGLAEKRSSISIEKVAINYIHSTLPDNEGVLIEDRPILENGPPAFFTSLPLLKMKNIQTSFPVELSLSAGTYVCNLLMYQVLNYVKDSDTKAGFIHLPHLEQNTSRILASLTEMFEVL